MSNFNRHEWMFAGGSSLGKKLDKDALIWHYQQELINDCMSIFKYDGLPLTTPKKYVELYMILYGYVIMAKANDGNWYAFFGQLGEILNEYYFPTKALVNNPYLRFNKTLTIGKDCVVIYNDSLLQGLAPLIQKYSVLLAECDLTLRTSLVNARIPAIVTGDDDNMKESAKEFFNKAEDGELSAIMSEGLSNGLRTEDYFNRSSTVIKDVIEAKQYIKASFWNDVGLQANYNMKREAINDAEAGMNVQSLKPRIDDMIERRQIGWDEFNKLSGLNVTFELSSSWKQLDKEVKLQEEIMKKEAEQPSNEEPVKEGAEDEQSES